MQKALFYIVAGEDEGKRAVMGLTMAKRSHEFKRFADVKVIMQGTNEKLIIEKDPSVKEVVDYLIQNNVIDSACKFIAEQLEIGQPIIDRGVELKPAGERMSSLVNDGYIPIVF